MWFREDGRDVPWDCGVPCRVRVMPGWIGGDAEGAWFMCWKAGVF